MAQTEITGARGPSSTAVGAVLLAGVMSACTFDVPALGQSGRSSEFQPVRVLGPQRPITDPPLIEAAQAGSRVTNNELVLGVTVEGQARAYPINMLTGPAREIINDTLGGVPIAATWCHLCHNAIVYNRRVGERTLTLTVSGMLWNRNLVIMDVETRSLWSHLLGRAMSGTLRGRELSTVPSVLTTWEEWRREHPRTTVLAMSRSSREFVRAFYRNPEQFVFGFNAGGRQYHGSFSVLQRNPVLNLRLRSEDLLITFDPGSTAARLFERTVEGRELTFSATADGRMKDEETGTIWDRSTGQALQGPLKEQSLRQRVGMPAFATSWKTFHPRSRDVRPNDGQ